ncbi:MAG: DUF3793 family protein [Clostridia bacterium]|nr:DUF3793 family protein [Clostridia bacterium]
MRGDMMERMIAYHCAPALAGIKPSNVLTCYKSKTKNILGKIEKFNKELNRKGIYAQILYECEKKVLVMVYRRGVFEKNLRNEKVRKFLFHMGYPYDAEAEEYLDILKKRMKNGEIHHEIGAFLGYPICDVAGFINNKGRGYLISGEWKVYENAEAAKKLFHRFEACRCALCNKIDGGKSLSEIFV